MKTINALVETVAITKTGTFATTFHKTSGGWEVPYVCFGYIPLKNFNQTWGKVSGSMNSDPIKMMHTSQQSTKERFNK